MKKNLQKVLILALGLTTTIASAQWSANSTTWVDNAEDSRTAITRSTVTLDMSGVHVSTDHVWGTEGYLASSIYEAYVSTDVMGYGTLTLGRQDLSFGSGALISSNEWGYGVDENGDLTRYTTDGANFAASFSGFDINAGTLGGINQSSNYINAAGSFSGVSVNVLMIDNNDTKSHGYDFGYSMMDGALNLSYSMNDDGQGSEMTHMGASYQVFDNMSANASMRSYEGENTDATFSAANSAWNDGLAAGVLPHLDNGTEVLSYGLTYNLGDIALSYTMHNLSEEGYVDMDLSDMSVSYKLNDNTTLGYRSYSMGAMFLEGGDVIEAEDYNYITIQIGM